MGFILFIDNDPEIKERWHGAGTVILWVIFYFWAVWVFDALLPSKSEQSPFEAYWGGQVQSFISGNASAHARTPEEQDLQMTAEGIRR